MCKNSLINDSWLICPTENISTEELAELKKSGLPIYFRDTENWYNEYGCYYDSGIGWSPKGFYCGECSGNYATECPRAKMESGE